jgi:hypothetical protein
MDVYRIDKSVMAGFIRDDILKKYSRNFSDNKGKKTLLHLPNVVV